LGFFLRANRFGTTGRGPFPAGVSSIVMSDMVDYQKWLDIPPEDSASGGPNHYRLLGLELFEADRATVDAAAKSLMGFLQKQAAGPDQASVRKLLDEISDARRCLLLSDRKQVYDHKLRAKLDAAKQAEEADIPTVEPIDIEPPQEIAAAVPIPDEAVPEAEPLPDDEVEEAPEANPIDEFDDAPEAEPFDEIDEPTAVETIPEPPVPPSPPKKVAAPQPVAAQSVAPPKPAVAQPAATQPPPQPKPAPKPQPIAAVARPSVPAPSTLAPATPGANSWEDPDPTAHEGEIDGSFFSGMGLSSVRAGGAQTTAAAGAIAGTDFTSAKPSAKASANTKNSKSPATKTNPKRSAGAKTSAATQTEGQETVKNAPRKGPEMWQIMTGVGGGVVVLILVIAAFTNGDKSTPVVTQQHPVTTAKAEPPRNPFSMQTTVGPINDRTVRSPVTGAPVKVPLERHGDLFLVDVKINDQDVGKFLLDTGTTNLIISKEVADKLSLPARRSKTLKMPGGAQTVTERKIESLGIGMVRFDEPMILPQPRANEWLAIGVDIKPWAKAIGLPIAGVIGGEIWSQVPFSIDPGSNIVTFYKRGPFPFSAGQKPEFLTRFDNFLKPAMPASIDQGAEGTFVLATGAPHDVMLTGSAAPVKTLTVFGQDISQPESVQSKNGDGYFDANEIRQTGVIGAGILSHYILMFDYGNEKFLAVRIKR
jgi:hypothetical protein